MPHLKIVADRNIPFIDSALTGVGQLVMLPGSEIDSEVMRDADILLTRTRTRCDASLLDGSRCSFIGTATIGTDHIDLPYCASRGIMVANAPGCNAPAVAQYVLAAVSASLKPGESFSDKVLGIIGVGNVGSILHRWAEGLGMRVLLNDPPRQERGDSGMSWSSLEEIARDSDIISIHTPLTRSGAHPTYHLVDDILLSAVSRRPMIVNAARGPVTDTAVLKKAYAEGRISALAIDCWEGEPDIDTGLLVDALVATPHIAGYSFQGKVRATSMVLEALAGHLRDHFDIDINDTDLLRSLPKVRPVPATITADEIAYDILADTLRLKEIPAELLPATFETLRNTYPLRPEPRQ